MHGAEIGASSDGVESISRIPDRNEAGFLEFVLDLAQRI
jgi:hypothetical protein